MAEEKLENMTIEEKIGQMLLVRFEEENKIFQSIYRNIRTKIKTVSRLTSPMGGCRSTPPWRQPRFSVFDHFLERNRSESRRAEVQRGGDGRTHQNTSFVECGRSARPHSTKLGCFAVFGSRRLARPCWSGSLRSGRGLSCAPGPRSAARPCPAPPFVSPSPLGRLRTVVGGPRPPPPPPPPRRGWRGRGGGGGPRPGGGGGGGAGGRGRGKGK